MERGVIEILSDSETDSEDDVAKPAAVVEDNSRSIRAQQATVRRKKVPTKKGGAKVQSSSRAPLQTGLVLEEDVDHTIGDNNNNDNDNTNSCGNSSDDTGVITMTSYIQQQEQRQEEGLPPILYHDREFESCPASIEGGRREGKEEKCRCTPSQPVAMSFTKKGPNQGKPYYHCSKRGKQGQKECNYFRWALRAQSMHWYRFGNHTGHRIVQKNGAFSANDLIQGRVGDCWFLSALAVIAEREDLIARLFGRNGSSLNNNNFGIVQVNLFVDGFWTKVIMDNFLPCIIDGKAENELQQAINASMGHASISAFQGPGYSLSSTSSCSASGAQKNDDEERNSSRYDPFALSDKNRQVLVETQNKIKSSSMLPAKLDRVVTTEDLAYSTAKKNQLWVPFLEKAYAKTHGCYQAISGGQIAEAFLDLTGAPTLVYNLHNDPNFEPRSFWYRLLSYRKQRLPMGCATSSSAVGIVGMHAYSILDVQEVKNVGLGFFTDKLSDRTLGNVSGFTEFDGTVRLLRIRNPHGKGEWQGEFSDKSKIWDKLLQHKGSPGLERTMKNDGVFWIDYDAFLMAFCRVDVVLAFMGNHARSFRSNFPEKLSTHRCARAFELCLLDPQPGIPSRDTVEVYVMGIQKTKRGAYHGRADRKVSYKLSDMGVLVGSCKENYQQCDSELETDGSLEFDTVDGQMFGFRRDCHYKMILDRNKKNRLVVMPISFGHPAATDSERSFAVRFVADAPLHIRELVVLPKMDKVLKTYAFGPRTGLACRQRERKIILDDEDGRRTYGESRYRVVQINCLDKEGGVVFIFLCVNEQLQEKVGMADNGLELNLAIEATCRGMMMRIESGFVTHETVAKGKKYQAAWRKFSTTFQSQSRTRLLAVMVQSGQDSEMGSVTCKKLDSTGIHKDDKDKKQTSITAFASKLPTSETPTSDTDHEYERLGIFHASKGATSLEMQNTMFGAAADVVDVSMIGPDTFDMELENALALSRGDIELRDALEMSKRETGPISPGLARGDGAAMHLDEEMQIALERSMAETSGSSRYHAAAHVETIDVSAGDGDLDHDLNEAIKRSLEETKRSCPNDVVEIDITGGNESSSFAHAKKQKTEKSGEIAIEVDSVEATNSSREHPRKTTESESDIIEIADDGEEEESDSDLTKKMTEEKQKQLTAADKRRLAAEAAERRFRSLQNK